MMNRNELTRCNFERSSGHCMNEKCMAKGHFCPMHSKQDRCLAYKEYKDSCKCLNSNGKCEHPYARTGANRKCENLGRLFDCLYRQPSE